MLGVWGGAGGVEEVNVRRRIVEVVFGSEDFVWPRLG